MSNNYLSPSQKIIFDEVKRRGYQLQQLRNTNVYYFETKGKVNFFIAGYTNAVPYNCGLIISNKSFVRELLKNNRLSIAKGKLFLPDETENALIYAKKMGFPIIIRQENSQLDIKSITPKNQAEFKKGFSKLSEYGEGILVEKIFKGEKYRIFITSGGQMNIVKQSEPLIIGDGKSTLRQLVRAENIRRINLVNSYIHPIKINNKIIVNNDLEEMLKNGQKIRLKGVSNVEDGAIYEETYPKNGRRITKIAEKILKSFPKSRFITFEIISRNVERMGNKDYIVTEVYISPGYNLFFKLMSNGQEINPAKEIINLLTNTDD